MTVFIGRNVQRYATMLEMPAEIETIIASTRSAGKKIVPFLGSAASMFEPTSLPSWYKFIAMILSALEDQVPEAKEIVLSRQIVDDLYAGRIKAFEVTEAIAQRLGSDYLTVISSLANHEPNAFHGWIAEGLKNGDFPAIITTNFDRCIEDALVARGLRLCELTGDETTDRAALDEQSRIDQAKHVVVAYNPRGFKLLAQFPGIIGRESHAFILKLHGTARHPESCVDTAAQRLQGLSAPIAHVLSVILQRFPLFFMGFGGGDLETGLNYLRLQSERDLATVHWLVRPGDAEPDVFKMLARQMGNRFQIVRAAIPGKITGINTALASRIKQWGSDIGTFWARLVMIDLAALVGASEAVMRRLVLPVSADPGASKGINAAITKAIASRPDIGTSTSDQVAISTCVNQAADALARGDVREGFKRASDAVRLMRKGFPDARSLPDSWVPTAMLALSLEAAGLEDLAYTFGRDALEQAILAGSIEGIKFIERWIKDSHLSARESIVSTDAMKTSPVMIGPELLSYVPAFDNTNALLLGIPEATYIKAELHRALLTSDKVVIGPNFLLNSRVFITEVLSRDGKPDERYLGLIRPLLPRHQKVKKAGVQVDIDFVSNENPIAEYRTECQVNRADFLHEKIDPSYYTALDAFYSKHRDLFYWYDFDTIAGNYGGRTLGLLERKETVNNFSGDDAARVAEIIPAMREFVRACLEGGMLTRSQLYKFGNLFREPTSDAAFKKEFADAIARLGDTAAKTVMDARNEAIGKPWFYHHLFTILADSAYMTNLPIVFRFALSIDEQAKKLFDIISPIVKAELGKDVIFRMKSSTGTIRSIELARIDIEDILRLRESSPGIEFRKAFRDVSKFIGRESELVGIQSAYYEYIKKELTPPEEREIPPDISPEQPRAITPDILGPLAITVSRSRPISPMYDIPALDFPGLVPMVPVENVDGSDDMKKQIEQIKKVLVYSSPDNPWVKLYYDHVRFPGGKEGRYNVIVENDG
ncbi:MAG: SIR2 family protein, partial [Candidatus Sigynarchaeota archaeon]